MLLKRKKKKDHGNIISGSSSSFHAIAGTVG